MSAAPDDAPPGGSAPAAKSEANAGGKRRMGVGAQLYSGLIGAIVLTLSASLVAYFSFREILGQQSRLAEYSVPNLIDSVEVARQSAVVVNGAVRLIAAASQAEHDAVAEELARDRKILDAIIGELQSRSAFSAQAQRIQAQLAELGVELERIRESAARRLVITRILTGLAEELAETNRRIERMLVTAVDDQGFYLAEGLRRLEDQPDPVERRASASELAFYRDLIRVNHQASLGILLLDEALALSDRRLLEPLQERFHSAVENFRRAYAGLSSRSSNAALGKDLEALARIGESAEGIIPLRREALRRLEQERDALASGRERSEQLLAEVNALVEDINLEAVQASEASRAAVRTGIALLILLNVLSVAGAGLIGWLFVGRYLVRRLVKLAKAMRSMAGGDLEVPVEVRGNDEVSDMANALEVFRRHALEVQRLNLVEKLAQELDAKNSSLEQALKDLKRAQEQIVAEEKLSSLGQLTAGVAHEIKNPLNFISNFSDVSAELIDEIGEMLEEAKEGKLELAEEIEDILPDLRTNLKKVKEHSQRADGIVRSMLEHSRATPGEWRPEDVNALLKRYVDLAYHSLRAKDAGFNLKLSEDLDPNMGQIEVIPQDLGRVFLNLATNACQALDEKRRHSGPDYMPELTLTSRRLQDQAEFRVRDNGPGIPEELRKKVFEPFVTTKPTGEGTGLGLSLVADILTRHGGSIQLDTKAGEFTEMRILLPLERPPDTAR